MIKENATMIVSQYNIDRLQKALDEELARRSNLSGLSTETHRDRGATICVPMETFKSSEDSALMVIDRLF